jgi:predicted negative regulator of RcsB-dependent stress response
MDSVKEHIPREDYTHGMSDSIKLEKDGDVLVKLGKSDLAMRTYKKSLSIEAKLIGKDHAMVSSFVDKMLKQDDWKSASQRDATRGLAESLTLEKEGDTLQKLGKPDFALRQYQKALHIEQQLLGEDHPMVTSLQEKIALANLAAEKM